MRNILFVIIIALLLLGCAKSDSFTSSDKQKMFTMYDNGSIKIEELESTLDSAISQDDKFQEGLLKLAIGRRLRNKSQFNKALQLHRSAQNIAYEIEDTLMMIKSYNEIGTVYRRVDALNEAITFHYKALQYSELYSDSTSYVARKQKTMALNGIGNISLVLEFYDKAEESFRECLKIESMLKSDIGLAINYANIGAIYDIKDMRDSAMLYYNLSLNHNIKANSQIGMSLCYNYIGHLYEKDGELTKAKEYYVRGYENIKSHSDLWHKLVLHISIARINIKQGDYSEGVNNLEQAYKYAEELSSPEHLAAIYKLWADYYEATGNIKLAIENLKKSYENSDLDRRKKDQESLMQTNINFITELSNEHADLQVAIIEQHKQMQGLLYFTVLVCILALVMLGCLFYFVRNRNRKLVEINAMKNRLFSVISHDIKNPLISQRSVLELMVENIDVLQTEDIRSQCDDLLRSSGSLLDMLYNLLNWSQIESKTIRYNPINVDLLTIAKEVEEMFYIILSRKNIKMNIEIEQGTIAYGDYNMISTIIRNLTNNAIKYSYSDSSILITASNCNNKMWRVTVRDYGVGISNEVLPTLFKLNAVKTKNGTIGESGTGMGLMIVKQMVEMNGGEVTIESEVNKGTAISFTVNKDGDGEN